MVRRFVYSPSAVSCWRSIALRLIMVRRGVYRPSVVCLLAFYRRAVAIGLPWRVSFVPAVLLALYRRTLVLICRFVYSPSIALRW